MIAAIALLDAADVNAWWLAIVAVPATLWWSLLADRKRAVAPGPPSDGGS
jgi:hypothetical protein